ncbi:MULTISPECIES: hypothetical protein [Brachybacterium]|uniref:hypothetical protein n=1 Tax=Brachybacterium TaxID=43668 RepID=UPI0006B496F9|nr:MULTISPECIES: hypothetical protein [Brachybacterium]GAP78931.1 hypothetical protein Y09_1765 [Brachybacterium sp. SW0106-09]
MHLDDHAATWRDQLIELSLPGVGAVTARVDTGPTDTAPADAPAEGFRRREPTVPPARETVRRTLAARPPLMLEHAWLVVPALGPVLPVEEGVGLVGDLSGLRPPVEVRGESALPARPSREGAEVVAPIGERRRRPLSPRHGWYRVPAVAAALRARGGIVGRGALVGPRREWFEPAVATREDLLGAHPDQALESALAAARELGQVAVLRIGPDGLDVHPTGADPRVPVLEELPLQVTDRPAQCPLQGEDACGPCRPVGGPWIRASQEAQLDWEARRAQAVGMLGCGVCFGEALPPEPDQPQVPRLAEATPVTHLDRLHLRGGGSVQIDPLIRPR